MKKIITIIASVILALICTACGTVNASDQTSTISSKAENILTEDYDVVSIVVDIHKYAPMPDFAISKTVINKVCHKRGRFIISETGGAPYIAYDDKLPDDPVGVASATSKHNSEAYASELTEFAKTLSPEAPENDMLSALSITLKKHSLYGGSHIMLVEGPGIFTTGPLDMSYLMSNETENVIQKLEESNIIPHVDCNLTVIWSGLGEPVGDQPKPSDNDYVKLENFYREYFIAAGAKDVLFIPSGINSDWDNPSYPDVSIYKFPNATIIGEDTVEFKRNSAEFMDSDRAIATIESIARNYSVDEKILVLGFASSEGSPSDNIHLSQQRAARVAEILTSKGLIAKSVGRGYDTKFCVPDTTDGVFDERLAAKNRKIIVMNLDSAKAQSLVD